MSCLRFCLSYRQILQVWYYNNVKQNHTSDSDESCGNPCVFDESLVLKVLYSTRWTSLLVQIFSYDVFLAFRLSCACSCLVSVTANVQIPRMLHKYNHLSTSLVITWFYYPFLFVFKLLSKASCLYLLSLLASGNIRCLQTLCLILSYISLTSLTYYLSYKFYISYILSYMSVSSSESPPPQKKNPLT